MSLAAPGGNGPTRHPKAEDSEIVAPTIAAPVASGEHPVVQDTIDRAQPETRPFDPAPVREQARLAILYVFLGVLVAVIVGVSVGFAVGRLKEESLLLVISSFMTLLGSVIGFYFAHELTRK